MIGMMNAGTVDVPDEFYGDATKKSQRLFTRKQMLHEKISYAKDGRMLVNGRLAVSNEVLTPTEMWEGLMMRVMCRAVCESYMKKNAPPKRRFIDYLPWRRRSRKSGKAAVTAITNAANAVSELRAHQRKDSVSSTKSPHALFKALTAHNPNNKSPRQNHKLSSESSSFSFKENKQDAHKKTITNVNGDNASTSSDNSNSLSLRNENSTASNSNPLKYSAFRGFKKSPFHYNKNNNTIITSKKASKSTAIHNDDIINSTAAKISAKITLGSATSQNPLSSERVNTLSRIVRSSSSSSLKTPNYLYNLNYTNINGNSNNAMNNMHNSQIEQKPIVNMRKSMCSARRPISISTFLSLATRASPRQALSSNTTKLNDEHKLDALHTFNLNNKDITNGTSSNSSKFFSFNRGNKIPSASSITKIKQENTIYNKTR